MTILITGIDGYLGWPAALRIARENPDERIIGIDNFGRRRWVEECGGVSAIPIKSMKERIQAAERQGWKKIQFIEGDLTDKNLVNQLLRVFKPETVLHIAAQPSAPYSQINGERASYTQYNNNESTRNLLWGLKENRLLDTHFIATTTTGVYGAPEFPIPEGFFEVEYKGQKDILPFPNMAGSWYHMSKCTDINNFMLASKQWKLPISDLRTAIVYGTETEETILDPDLSTRFDFDFYFGVVTNRFCAMALAGHPITIYGKGEQRKPMISLEDAVTSLAKAIHIRPKKAGEMEIYNQFTKVESIKSLADAIKATSGLIGRDIEVKHIQNPRVEKETHKMVMENDYFRNKLLPQSKVNLQDGILGIMTSLQHHKDKVIDYMESFME